MLAITFTSDSATEIIFDLVVCHSKGLGTPVSRLYQIVMMPGYSATAFKNTHTEASQKYCKSCINSWIFPYPQ